MRTSKIKIAGAFTLVETLVALSVAAVLLAMVMSGLSYASRAGDRVRCMSNLRQATAGFRAYTIDHRGAFPAADAWYNRGYDSDAPGMREYMNVSENNDEVRIDTIWTCPALQRDPDTKTAQNAAFHRTYSLNLCATTGHKQYSLSNVAKVANPGQMITFFDGSISTKSRNANVYHIGHGYRHYPERLTKPHEEMLNVAFYDGRVERMSIAQLLATEGLEERWEGK